MNRNDERQANQMDQPETVITEEPAWSRLLALYPDLGFDRSVATQVCASWAFPASTLGWPHGDQSVLVSFLQTFRHDDTREEFLWHYIEAVTGEQDVHLKEY